MKDTMYLYKNYSELSDCVARLNECGNQPYDLYVRSQVFAVRRQAYLDYTGNLCQCCGKPITSHAQLHHFYYVSGSNHINIVGIENINDVAIMHARCHHQYHVNQDNNILNDTASWAMYPIKPYVQGADEW